MLKILNPFIDDFLGPKIFKIQQLEFKGLKQNWFNRFFFLYFDAENIS